MHNSCSDVVPLLVSHARSGCIASTNFDIFFGSEPKEPASIPLVNMDLPSLVHHLQNSGIGAGAGAMFLRKSAT